MFYHWRKWVCTRRPKVRYDDQGDSPALPFVSPGFFHPLSGLGGGLIFGEVGSDKRRYPTFLCHVELFSRSLFFSLLDPRSDWEFRENHSVWARGRLPRHLVARGHQKREKMGTLACCSNGAEAEKLAQQTGFTKSRGIRRHREKERTREGGGIAEDRMAHEVHLSSP